MCDHEPTELDPRKLEAVLAQDPWLRDVSSQLARLSTRHQVCFSLCCAELLLPAYYRTGLHLGTTEDVAFVKSLVSRLWDYATTGNMTLDPNEAKCQLAAIDTGEEGCCADWCEAIDALSALDCVVETLEGSFLNIVGAAVAVQNCLDRRTLDDLLGPVSGPHCPGQMAEINRRVEEAERMVEESRRIGQLLNRLAQSNELTAEVAQRCRAEYLNNRGIEPRD